MRARTALLAAVLVAVASRAWALCPNCLGQSSRLGAALRLVGLFLLVPPAVFFAVAIAVRKLSSPAEPGGRDRG